MPQYLHEDDLTAIIAMFLTTPRGPGLEVFNLAPEDALSSDDHAAFYGKRVLLVPPLLLRAAFSLIWHGTRGAFTTPPGAADAHLSDRRRRPRLTRVYGYRYGYSSAEALTAGKGEHAGAAQSLILERRPTLRPMKAAPHMRLLEQEREDRLWLLAAAIAAQSAIRLTAMHTPTRCVIAWIVDATPGRRWSAGRCTRKARSK